MHAVQLSHDNLNSPEESQTGYLVYTACESSASYYAFITQIEINIQRSSFLEYMSNYRFSLSSVLAPKTCLLRVVILHFTQYPTPSGLEVLCMSSLVTGNIIQKHCELLNY